MRLNAIVAALLIILFSPAVLALSLGEAKPQSHLNQPLKATIVVRSVKYDERDTIRAIIPDAEKFKRAGVRRDAIVENMRIEVTDGIAEDELLIHITTEKRILEPFVNFLVEVRWLGGSVIREYTLLLDPATVAENRTSGAPSQSAGSYDMQESPVQYSDEVGYQSNPASSTSSKGSHQYGPVKRHETLWSIALSQRTDPGITMDQMQLAIYQANPQAFDGNINQMRTGSFLTIPSNSEIRAIAPSQAKSEVTQQKKRYQPPAPVYKAPASAPVPAYEPAPAPEPEPEPVEPELVVYEEAEPEVPGDEMGAIETAPDVAQSEPRPGMAAASATADGEALTEDELVAEGDQAEVVSGDIEMPSVWVDENPAEAGTADAEQPAQPGTVAENETVVDDAPAESGFDLGPLADVVSPVTLALAVVLIIVLLLTYWWYRKRSVKNVGSQFAYASVDDADDDKESGESEKKNDAVGGKKNSPGSVWSDEGGVPDSIDEYTASTAGSEELDLDEISPVASMRQAEVSPAMEMDSDDTSPIREMSSEEIDYLGESDVHLAYGLYDEAALVLQRGINENPHRADLRLKLLEAFHSGSMSEEFVQAAEAWKETGEISEDHWKKVEQMGKEVAPDSALFGAGLVAAKASSVAEKDDQFDAPAVEVTENIAAADEKPESAKESSDDGSLDFDLSGFDIAGSAEDETQHEDDVQVDLPDIEDEFPEPVVADESEVIEQVDEGSDEDGLDFTTLDYSGSDDAVEEDDDSGIQPETLSLDHIDDEIESPEKPEPAFETEDRNDLEDAVEGISPRDSTERPASGRLEPVDTGESDDDALQANLEPGFDQFDDAAIADDPAIDGPASSSEGDEEEVSVKLDLARAYMDMGEPEMARALLDEVIEMGSEQQRQEARDLIARA